MRRTPPSPGSRTRRTPSRYRWPLGGTLIVLTVALSHGKSQSAYSSLPQCVEQEGAAVTLNCIEQINQWCQVHEPQVDLGNCSADALTWVATKR